MRNKKLTFIFLLSLSLTSISYAKSKLSCSYLSKDGGRGCFFSSMQMYDQRTDVSDGSNYCAPTAAAMALSALTFGGVHLYVNSWTRKNFDGKTKEQRIEAFADLFNTDPDNGTNWSNGTSKFKNREADFPKASGNVDSARTDMLNDWRMRQLVRRNEVDVIRHGHYTETCTGTGSSKVCKYERKGGHIVTLNGYYYTPGSNVYTSHIYDPWNGVEVERDIKKLADKTKKKLFGFINLDYRTYKSKTHYLKSSGNYFAIIDNLAGINTN